MIERALLELVSVVAAIVVVRMIEGFYTMLRVMQSADIGGTHG